MLNDLIRLLKPYNVADMLAKAAALQICPENADKATRLEALTHAISTIPFEAGKARVSRQKLIQLCNNPPLAKSDIQSQEDPAEQPFTEAYTFIGGSYTVFPGAVPDATFVLRHLNKAIFFKTETSLDKNFVRLVREANGAILTTGNEIAKRAGIRRNLPPQTGPGKDIFVPKDLDRLQSAVTFSFEEISRPLNRIGMALPALDPFTLDFGTIKPDDFTVEFGPLNARPLVRANSALIVSQPGVLLAALRHRILMLAVEFGLTGELAKLYKEAVWHTVATCLGYFGHRPVTVPLPPLQDDVPLQDGFWTLDTDKALYVSLSYDDLSDYSDKDIFGATWKHGDLSSLIEQRQLAAEEIVFQHAQGLNELCALYVHVGVGRGTVFGFDAPPPPLKSPRTMMSVSDLETIALLEASDPLIILKYAKASDVVRDTTKIFAWSTLDEFTIYRDSKYSYYLSDGARPSMMTIASGSGSKLRYEVLQRFDFHSAPHFRPGYVVEVAALYGTSDIPVYIPREDAGKRLELLVEGLPVLIWIVGSKEPEELRKLDIYSLYAEFADMLGYWLWQFTPSLARYLNGLTSVQVSVLVIRLDLVPGRGWTNVLGPNESPEGPSIEYEIHPKQAEITLRFGPEINKILASPDNRGERIILGKVLEAISEFLATREFSVEASLLKSEVGSILSKHAPLGLKKKLNVLNANANPQLDPNNIPRFRKVQDADQSNLLDDLGLHLRQDLRLTEGAIPDSSRTKVLRSVVDFFYRRLQKLVATLSPVSLLEYLVAQNEAIVHERASQLLTIPTQLACFEAEQNLLEQLNRQLPETSEAATSSRFLIEYVAARPPSGLRPISLGIYDELLALASEILDWAYESDLIQYGIVDISLAILRSGRLGASRRILQQAHQRYIPIKSREEIRRAHRTFERNWPIEPSNKNISIPTEVAEIDEAFEAEFGLKLTDVTALLTEVANIGFEHTTAPLKQMGVEELLDELSRKLSWPEQKVIDGFTLLTLSPRSDYLKPPSPFSPEDVYPWRFTRPLSYTRRPLLQIANQDGNFVCWGTRHVFAAMEYIVDLCLGGRLQAQAKSKKMRDLIGKIHREDGRLFARHIAGLFEKFSNLIVKTNVRKIGKVRIGAPGNDLGDIDVLVIWPRKHRILAIECKDLAIARTPKEMANELQELFRGTENRVAAVTKHQRRCRWIKGHIQDLLESNGVPARGGGRWKVEPILVVSEEMLTPHLYSPPFPVFSLERFERDFFVAFSSGKLN